MEQNKVIVGFMGAGGIARSHVFALNSLKYYYDDAPGIELSAVCSLREESRDLFAVKYGFTRSCDPADFIKDDRINTVFILGPNKVHHDHLKAALGMKSVKRIYLEKPVCSSPQEEDSIRTLIAGYPCIRIQVGFQYLFSSAVRDALVFWKSGKLGKPLHFDFRYYHGDYLKQGYRDKRKSRLTPAPDGGAMADLGSHAISLLLAFLGNDLKITGGFQAGCFEDVPETSDLFSNISILDKTTLAAGSLSSSRISSGTGDYLSFEIFAEKGTLRYSTLVPDSFEFFTEETGAWTKQVLGSNYRPFTGFPSGHVPPGWHRSMIHGHYIFTRDLSTEPVIPDIVHGLEVQRLVRETAEFLQEFRYLRYNVTKH